MPLISKSYFKIFHRNEEAEQSFRNGVFIDWFDRGHERVAPYHYNEFIVQVFCSKSYNQVLRLEAMNSVDAAEEYINIDMYKILNEI